MINPKKLLNELNKREDDSKRIDFILESMISRHDMMDRTILYFANNYAMLYDAEFKVFQIDHDGQEITIFKDGREAIDYCLSPPSEESSHEINYEIIEENDGPQVLESDIVKNEKDNE